MKDAKGHGSDAHGGAAHQSAVRSLARGLHTDWSAPGMLTSMVKAKGYESGGFASQSMARRQRKATNYVEARAKRSSSFKLT